MNSSVHDVRTVTRSAANERHRRLARLGERRFAAGHGWAGTLPVATPRRSVAVSR